MLPYIYCLYLNQYKYETAYRRFPSKAQCTPVHSHPPLTSCYDDQCRLCSKPRTVLEIMYKNLPNSGDFFYMSKYLQYKNIYATV